MEVEAEGAVASFLESDSGQNSGIRRRTLAQPKREGDGLDDLASCKELESWVRSRQATFVVGPGCSRLGWNRTEITRPVAAAMVRVFEEIEDQSDRDFLARLASRRGIDLSVSPDPSKPTDIESALKATRLSLVTAARVATERLLDGLRAWNTPITDWHVAEAPLGSTTSAILKPLKAALGALDNLTSRVMGAVVDDRLPDARQDWEDVRDLFDPDAIRGSLDGLTRVLEQAQVLEGQHVEWLTMLVWHSFRYAAPWPPSTDELAFQLGISERSTPLIIHPDRALATQLRTSQNDAIVMLRRIYERAEEAGASRGWEDRSRLFRSIAELAFHGLGSRAGAAGGSEGGSSGTGRFSKKRKSTVWGPVVLCSSFDRELDRAFDDELHQMSQGGTKDPHYHVLVPVLVTEERDDTTAEIRWVLGTYDVEGPREWQLIDETSIPLSEGVPTVVKLNGDPHLTLGQVGGFWGAGKLQPLVVLTEFQHLSLLMAEERLFEGLGSRGLPDRGRFILLAESVGEWSIRQRLFGHTMHKLWSDQGRQVDEEVGDDRIVEAISINRRPDLVRHSLFGWVNIREYRGDLKDIVGKLENLAKEASRP